MDIYAHRGFSSKFTENTKKAFEACKNLNIKGIELDVQLSKDGKIVVYHDENIKRLTGIDKNLKDLDFCDLKEIKFEDGQTFLSLEEYLNIVSDTKLTTNVELKTGKFPYPGIEEAVYQAFKRRNMLDRLLISSFNHKSLVRFKKIDPKIPLAALFSNPKSLNEKYLEENGIKIYHPNYIKLSFADLRRYKKKNITVNLRTVNSKFEYFKYKLFGADGIITNYPDM